jgi:GNAT superfamily N-acetyltransferase
LRTGELERLITIEQAASCLLAAHGHPTLGAASMTQHEMARLVDGRDALVAVDHRDQATGFAVAGDFAGIYWLNELSVDPEFGRSGIGSALLEAIADRARRAGHQILGLSTFRDVPFNAPFYRKRGFVIVEPEMHDPLIAERLAQEVPTGSSLNDRCVMLRQL